MKTLLRAALAAAGIALIIILFLVLRPGGDEADESAPTTTATTTAPPSTATTTRPTATTARPPGPTTLRLLVRDGRVAGGPRSFEVRKGTRVVLVVRADVEDEVHLHGYDLESDVRPGTPARIAFRASLAGRFEVELEGRHLRLAEIEVTP